MTKFEVLATVFNNAGSLYADPSRAEQEYNEVGISGMLDNHFMESKFVPFTVDEFINAFIDDVNEAYVFENIGYVVIGATLISVSATEWGNHFDVRKEAYISIARVSAYAKRIK